MNRLNIDRFGRDHWMILDEAWVALSSTWQSGRTGIERVLGLVENLFNQLSIVGRLRAR